jgi:hypothetical protein
MYRSRQIKPAPITSFDVGDISDAYRYFSSKERVGKIVVSLENPESQVPVCIPQPLYFPHLKLS